MECKWKQKRLWFYRLDCFNLNLLECKFVTAIKAGERGSGFNLNLLECKFSTLSPLSVGLKCFNLNLLECKFFWNNSHVAFNSVLISTYWNVNCSTMHMVIVIQHVLISTYWNVNWTKIKICGNRAGFNLNLLECKSEQMRSKHLRIQSFNLNLLECKLLLFERCTETWQVLISTYWNVNFSALIISSIGISFNLNLLECKST